MTKRIEVASAPAPLEEYAQQFDRLFGKSNQREGFRRYVEGLLLPSERHKTLTGLTNTEPVGGAHQPRAQRLQWFLSESDWDEREVQAERLRLLRQDPVSAPTAQGVLVIDETGDRKDGHQTAHVSRQYLANLGKIDNGVVSVSSLWADEGVYSPVDFEPSTPAVYFAKGKNDAQFRTKLKLALQLVERALQEGMPFRAVVADSFYGEDRGVRGGLQELKVPYVMALKPSHDGRASRGRRRFPARRGARGRMGEVRAARQVGADHENLSRWPQRGLVGGGDCGRTVWASQGRTSGGGYHRSTDVARSQHLVSGDEPACSSRARGNRTPVCCGESGRGDQALWAAHVGRAELQTHQTGSWLVPVPGEKRQSHPTALAIGVVRLLVLLVSRLSLFLRHAARGARDV